MLAQLRGEAARTPSRKGEDPRIRPPPIPSWMARTLSLK